MSLSNNWGFPILGPFPDIFGISLYRVSYSNGKYSRSIFPVWWYKLRARIVRLYSKKPVFIHELQAEPWGPRANHEMERAEQLKSMNIKQLETNINFARKTNLYPVFLWGLEWWYANKNDHEFVARLKDIFKELEYSDN